MYVCVVSLDYLCRSQVCARWIPVHLRCIQCSILLHLIDICLLPCRYRKSRLVFLWLSDLD